MTDAVPELRCLPVTGIPEVQPGDDLAALLADALPLADGDFVVVTSKVVSKAEGRIRELDRTEAVAQETDRVVARRGATSIVRTRHGLVMAAAGVDASNTATDTVVLLPLDPDASARSLREGLLDRTGHNVAVVVTDTSGRAWRTGQTDIAIGAAGFAVLHDYAGRTDPYGNVLSVTAPAVADEIAAAADLVKGKLGRCPAAVVRGLRGLVLAPGDHGPGATALVRPESEDLFGLGAREAVLRAVDPKPDGLRGFGGPAPAEELAERLRHLDASVTAELGVDGSVRVTAGVALPERAAGRLEARLTTVASAFGWLCEDTGHEPDTCLIFRPATP